MYINFAILKKYKLNVEHFILLQMCKQNKSEDLSVELMQYSTQLNWLMGEGYLTTVKPKRKTDTIFNLTRLSKKGTEVLNDINTPAVTEDDLTLFNWLCEVYTTEDKLIGNKRKTKIYIAEFRVNSGIQRNELAHLLEVFLEDEENMMFNNKLEYAFFKPTNVYQSKFDLDQSRLWQYYLRNKEEIDAKYQQRILDKQTA